MYGCICACKHMLLCVHVNSHRHLAKDSLSRIHGHVHQVMLKQEPRQEACCWEGTILMATSRPIHHCRGCWSLP